MRTRHFLTVVFLLCGLHNIKTDGQVVATWTDVSGNWSNGSNWSTLTAPNNSGGTSYDALINGTGADTVTFDTSGTVINNLTLGAGETFQDNGLSPALRMGSLTNFGTINWQNGSNLTIAGTFTNNLPFNGELTGTVNITGLSTLRTGDVHNLGALNIDASHLVINGDYSAEFPGFSTLQLQDGSVGTISGSIISCAPHTCTTGISVSNSSLNIGGSFLSGDAGVSGGTLRVQGGLQVLEGGTFGLQGSSAVINGGISGEFVTAIQIDNSSVIAGGLFLSEAADAFINNSSVTVNGIFVGYGSHLSVTGGSLIAGGLSLPEGAGAFINNSSVTVNGISVSGTGHLSVTGGTLTVLGDVQNGLPNNNLTGGRITLSGVANVMGGFTNSGGSVVVNPSATLTSDRYSQSGGSTDVSGTLSTASYKQSGGDTMIESGGLIKAGSFQATGGTVTVNGILDPTAVEIGPNAALRGIGTVIGNVAMEGTITPGAPGTPGSITIFGNYEQIGNGTLAELMSPLSQSMLNVTGDVALDSDSLLTITLLNGFNPLGRTFGIMDYSSLVGQFSNGSSFWEDGFLWDITYGQHQIDVTAARTAEPSSLLFLFVGLAAVALSAHRKMAKTSRLA